MYDLVELEKFFTPVSHLQLQLPTLLRHEALFLQ